MDASTRTALSPQRHKASINHFIIGSFAWSCTLLGPFELQEHSFVNANNRNLGHYRDSFQEKYLAGILCSSRRRKDVFKVFFKNLKEV